MHTDYYPKTSINEEWGVGNCAISQHPAIPIPNGSWDKSKNPYPLTNHIIPNLTTVEGAGITQPVASWFLDPNAGLVRNYAISQWVWVLAIMSIDHPGL